MIKKLRIFVFILVLFVLVFILVNISAFLKKKPEVIRDRYVRFVSKSDSPTASNRTLVIYVYFQKNPHHVEALRFFTQLGVHKNDNVDYIFVIQGGENIVKIPEFKNVKVLKRKNDCFDFGSISDVIKSFGGIGEIVKKYKSIIILNSSAFGPILPYYWPNYIHWSEIFTAQLKDNVHLVGTILTCLPEDDLGGDGPKVSGMAFAITPKAFQIAYNNHVFDCHKNKTYVIINGEYGLSRILLKEGLNIGTLLLKYGRVDWLNKENWNCNNRRFPFKKENYGNNMNIHPLETVFYKPIWQYDDYILSETYLKETYEYMRWARERAGIE